MGTEPPRDADLPAYPRNLIRRKAKELSRQRGFFRYEDKDLRQELTLRLLAELHRFDPERGNLNAFLKCVVETAAAMIARERKRVKRGGNVRRVSLDQAAATSGEGGPTLASQLTPLDLGRRLGIVSAEQIPASTVHAAIASLSPEDQAVCRALMTGTLSSAARKLGTSRRQIRNAIERIRKAFEEAGFDDH